MIKSINTILLCPDIVVINEKRLNSLIFIKNNENNIYTSFILVVEFSIHINAFEIVTLYEKSNDKIKNCVNIKHLIK